VLLNKGFKFMSQKKYLLMVTCTILLLSIGSLNGQQHMVLSLEKSIEFGLQNSKPLHSSLMKVRAADARSSEINAAKLPSLKFGGSYSRLSDVPPAQVSVPAGVFGPNPLSFTLSPTVLDNYNLRLSLQQPLFTGFRLSSSAEIADLTSKATSEEFNRDKSELVFAIKNSYWNLFKAIEFKKVIDENVGQTQAHLNDVRNWMNQGMLTTNDELRVEVQLSNAQLQQIDANNNVQLAMITLNNVIGQPLETQIELASLPDSVGSPEQMLVSGNSSEFVKMAIDRRSEIKAMKLRVDASEAGVTLARSGWYPQIYLNGNYYYSRPNQRIVPTRDEFKDTWDINLTASFDIWNWGTTILQTQQAQAQRSQAEDALGQLRDGITLEVTQNYLMMMQAKERIGVSRQAVYQAEENYRVTNEKFKLGVALNTDMLDAEVALLQAKTNFTQSLVDFQLAEARLEKSIEK
jgi:outer membrane protein TolC